ncbi:MAG: hypothetical protein HUJ42_02910 [Malacoplasma sp.]|nr:hypothetical protein [Malacoplasma sp.]
MKENKIDCLIWPELNDYTGKSKTIACFSSENDSNIDQYVSKIYEFWYDLTNWIIETNNKPTDLGMSLNFWFDMSKKKLSEKEIETLIKKVNEKYIMKNYIIKQNDLYDFSWKKFIEFTNKKLGQTVKKNKDNLQEYFCAVSTAFYGPVCDTFRQDETNTVSIIKILPSEQMVNALFLAAIKFISSKVASNHYSKHIIQVTSKILQSYLNLPEVEEVK